MKPLHERIANAADMAEMNGWKDGSVELLREAAEALRGAERVQILTRAYLGAEECEARWKRLAAENPSDNYSANAARCAVEDAISARAGLETAIAGRELEKLDNSEPKP